MIENYIKSILGEYAFQICVLQHQLSEVTKERDILKEKYETKSE